MEGWVLKQNLRLIRLLAVMLVAALLLPGAAAAEGMAYREVPVQVTVEMGGSGQGTAELATTLRPGEGIKVNLVAASGTGYVWQLANEPQLLKVVSKSDPQPLSEDQTLTGGPVRESFLLQAGDKPGQETLRFTLARPWESCQPAKTLAVTVTIAE